MTVPEFPSDLVDKVVQDVKAELDNFALSELVGQVWWLVLADDAVETFGQPRIVCVSQEDLPVPEKELPSVVRELAATVGALAVVSVAEAWMAAMPAEEWPKAGPVRDFPGARDVVVVQRETHEGHAMWSRPIVGEVPKRTWAGPWVCMEDSPERPFKGRRTGLVPSKVVN